MTQTVGFDFVDRRVMAAVQRVASNDPNPADPFRGLYISDETALKLTRGESASGADDRADALNRSVSARAFATGTDVYFAKGEYNPGSADGDRLIAHELAHVVQQRGAASTGPLTVSQPGDALETEADSVADSIA